MPFERRDREVSKPVIQENAGDGEWVVSKCKASRAERDDAGQRGASLAKLVD